MLAMKEIHDYATVYVNNIFIGTIDRRKNNSLQLPARNRSSVLCILVEAIGRVNYGGLMHDRKGIHGAVSLTSADKTTILKNWKHYRVPLGEKNLPVDFSKNMATGFL